MSNRLFTAGLAAPAVIMALALSACASSQVIDGQGGDGGPNSSTASGSTASGSPSGGSPAVSGTSGSAPSTSSGAGPAVTLAARLGQGLAQARTAHLRLDIGVAGHAVIGTGVERVSNGKLVALDLSESVANTVALRLITIGGRTYVHLPTSENTSGKPWLLVSMKSSNPLVKQLAASLPSTQSSASLSSITALVSAARSVRQTSSGGSTTSYAVDVDPAKLPGSYAGKQALIASGLTSIPLKITLDSSGRPVLVTEHLTVEGQSVSTRITISSYNKPVHIVAPPASQVSTH